MKELLEAEFHFGHRRGDGTENEGVIFGERNGIHIIDLQKTSNVPRSEPLS